MTRKMDRPRIAATDHDGKSREVRAGRLEIDFGDGRRLRLSFPENGWGDLEIEADGPGDETAPPLIVIQAEACNRLDLRIEARHDLPPAESPDYLAMDAPPPLDLTVQKAIEGEDRLSAPRKHQIRRWAQAALSRAADVTVRLVGEAEGRALNQDYRGKDHPTNVLTFVYDPDGDGKHGGGAPLRGDLVLCVPVVAREAREQNKALDAHFAHLVVHGMLHLQGFDHEDKDAAECMEARERDILHALGYADPYA
jgi:probable rRNA maturation factor